VYTACVAVNAKFVVPDFNEVSLHLPTLEELLTKKELRSVIGSVLSLLEQPVTKSNNDNIVGRNSFMLGFDISTKYLKIFYKKLSHPKCH
jgi:hypothetical protein